MQSVTIPLYVMSRYQEVTMAADIMFVNKIPIFMRTLRQMTTSQKDKVLLAQSIEINPRSVHEARLQGCALLADGQSKSLRCCKDNIHDIELCWKR
jgi:hypothetical protein